MMDIQSLIAQKMPGDGDLQVAVSASLVTPSLCAPDTTARSLDDVLLLCIDEVLLGILGRPPREAIYDYLERNHSLARCDVPNHLEELVGLLEKLFGKGGKTIEKSIIRRLVDELDWNLENESRFDFIDYIEAVRTRFSEHNST